MSRRPFDPRELDRPADGADESLAELERYVTSTATDAPSGFTERVMNAVAEEPAPRRRLLGWLLAPSPAGGAQRFARVGVLAATLVLAFAGALFAGELASLVRDFGSGETPTPSPTPSVTESVAPTPSQSIEATPPTSPDATMDGSPTPGSTGASPQATPVETPEASDDDTPEESETPRPSATATPAQTPG